MALDTTWAADAFEKIKEKIYVTCERIGDNIPYIPKDGSYLNHPVGLYWWTNGFWSGILWQMYNATGEELYKKTAEAVEEKFDKLLEDFVGLHHDVGFQWLHTAVANYRLTENNKSRARGLHAATLLAGRFNPVGRYIRAWNGDLTGYTIIDTMMNIPLLYWASKELNDPRFEYIAKAHADKTIEVTVRPDGSCNHICDLDPFTGDFKHNPGGQGFESGSSWSRGNAWALYGFALSYRHTNEARYLDTAKKIAHYFISNLAVNDWLPLVDFRAPKEPVKYDATAAMIAACGLLEIARNVPEHEKALYENAAMRTLKACDNAFFNWDKTIDGIVYNGSSKYHTTENDADANTAIIYGDYFMIEAVLRILGKDFLIW